MHLKPYNVNQENTAYSLTFSAPLQPQNNVKVMKSDIDKYSLWEIWLKQKCMALTQCPRKIKASMTVLTMTENAPINSFEHSQNQ